MLYHEFEAGNKTYRLRLNTRNIVELEKRLGGNPLSIFGSGERIPTVTEMVNILYCSMQQYEHGITVNDAYSIFDDYIADGKSTTDFITEIVSIYKVSGIIKEEEHEKN